MSKKLLHSCQFMDSPRMAQQTGSKPPGEVTQEYNVSMTIHGQSKDVIVARLKTPWQSNSGIQCIHDHPYTEEPITSPEILPEPPPQMQDDSIKTPNSQFWLVLSVTPCMPHISSIEPVNRSPSPLLFSPTPTISPTHAPTPDSPQDQPPPSST